MIRLAVMTSAFFPVTEWFTRVYEQAENNLQHRPAALGMVWVLNDNEVFSYLFELLRVVEDPLHPLYSDMRDPMGYVRGMPVLHRTGISCGGLTGRNNVAPQGAADLDALRHVYKMLCQHNA